MWVYNFGSLALEPCQTSNDGDGVRLWNADLLKPPDAGVKPGRSGWKALQSSVHRHFHRQIYSFVRPLLCMLNGCARAGCGYLPRFTKIYIIL